MRGKRTATPDRWRDEAAMASKPSSNTWTGSTWRTGPKRSIVWRRIQRSTSTDFDVGQPEYAFATGTSCPFPRGQRCIAQQAGAFAGSGLCVDHTASMVCRFDLPFPPVAALAPDQVSGGSRLSIKLRRPSGGIVAKIGERRPRVGIETSDNCPAIAGCRCRRCLNGSPLASEDLGVPANILHRLDDRAQYRAALMQGRSRIFFP